MRCLEAAILGAGVGALGGAAGVSGTLQHLSPGGPTTTTIALLLGVVTLGAFGAGRAAWRRCLREG
jgi:hypothetical protein